MATITYTISDLAHEFDLTTRAMRFYEAELFAIAKDWYFYFMG